MDFGATFCLLFLSLLIIVHPLHSGIVFPKDLYEGDSCSSEQGTGTCKKITECQYILEMAMSGQESYLRCEFLNFTEVVCCPDPPTVNQRIETRRADLECEKYQKDNLASGLNLHILGGTEVQPGEFPFMAALEYKNKDDKKVKYVCSGSLISKQHVLTAAHCYHGTDGRRPTQVRLGTVDLNTTDLTDVQVIAVDTMKRHPSYKTGSFYHDVAIIKLKTPVKITDKVRPVCLSTKSNTQTLTSSPNEARLIVTGWGVTDRYNQKPSSILLKTPPMSFVEHETCWPKYKGLKRTGQGFDRSVVCLKHNESTADACLGDSGGPVLVNSDGQETVVAVTSFGQSCGSKVPAIYMDVYYYIDWIESIVWSDNE